MRIKKTGNYVSIKEYVVVVICFVLFLIIWIAGLAQASKWWLIFAKIWYNFYISLIRYIFYWTIG